MFVFLFYILSTFFFLCWSFITFFVFFPLVLFFLLSFPHTVLVSFCCFLVCFPVCFSFYGEGNIQTKKGLPSPTQKRNCSPRHIHNPLIPLSSTIQIIHTHKHTPKQAYPLSMTILFWSPVHQLPAADSGVDVHKSGAALWRINVQRAPPVTRPRYILEQVTGR